MRLRSLVLVLLVVPIPVFAALYSGVRYGWWIESRPPPEISALLRPFDRVTLPEGAGPFPTALLFHGCGGVNRNMSDWARLFRDAGWASIVVDSFAGRGLDEETVCGGRALLGAERAGDVWVSLADARRLPFVDPKRIVLAGWSHGGWAIMDLLAMRAAGELPHNLSAAPDGGLEGIAGLMLVYPYCGIPARASVWRPSLPSLFLLAGADSVADPAPCGEVAEQLEARGDPVELVVFGGVDHAFDHPDLPAGSRLVYDPDTTRAAMQRARAFLTRLAGPRAR
jgi:dienelactone hydrolase